MKKHIAFLILGLLIGCGTSMISAQQTWYTTQKGLDVTDFEIIHAINCIEGPANSLYRWYIDSTFSRDYYNVHPSHRSYTIGAAASSLGIQALSANKTDSRKWMDGAQSGSCGLRTGVQGACYADDTSGSAANRLDQIAPQPFYETIVINYAVEGKFPNTYIRIVTLEGWQKAKYPIRQNGKGHLLIPGDTFTNGIFLYELMVDGEMVASRELVLTR
jgi:hypothetical protein